MIAISTVVTVRCCCCGLGLVVDGNNVGSTELFDFLLDVS